MEHRRAADGPRTRSSASGGSACEPQAKVRSTRVLPAVAPEASPAHQLPALPPPSSSPSSLPAERPLIVPGKPTAPLILGTKSGQAARKHRWLRPVASVLVVIVALVTVFGVGALQFRGARGHTANAGTPPPSGRGPWTTLVGSVVVIPPPPPAPTPAPQSASSASDGQHTGQGSGQGTASGPGMASPLEPCHESTMFVPNISQWTVPPGCYSLIYQPNPANYVSRPGFGYCNWWVRVTHPAYPDITENTSYPRGTTPVAGDAIFFDGGEQGALSDGHWAQAVAVAPDHYWVLISEMNFAWRGGGFGRIDYRYIHVSPHVHFVYGV